jgi:hypothetical protein
MLSYFPQELQELAWRRLQEHRWLAVFRELLDVVECSEDSGRLLQYTKPQWARTGMPSHPSGWGHAGYPDAVCLNQVLGPREGGVFYLYRNYIHDHMTYSMHCNAGDPEMLRYCPQSSQKGCGCFKVCSCL